MEQNFLVATEWLLLAFVASILSIRLGISVALMEITVGVIGGNVLQIEITSWVNFLAGFGAVVLTFLAGAEIDPESMKANLKESVSIGFLSFFLPFTGFSMKVVWFTVILIAVVFFITPVASKIKILLLVV